MPTIKKPEGLEDYESLTVKNSMGNIIIDILSLSAGLNMAIDRMNPNIITKKARATLQELISQSYLLFTYRTALDILKNEGIAKSEHKIENVSFRFDTPDSTHADLIIYYKFS